MADRNTEHHERCTDCGRVGSHEPGCYAGGGSPDAIRELLQGPLGKRCRFESGPDGRRISIYLTEDEQDAARRLSWSSEAAEDAEALWSIRCRTCKTNDFRTTPHRSQAVAFRNYHRNMHPGHDVRLISIPQE